ncbi:MAG: MoaD/ThiS family protein [Dehalococcoidia bacterium]
MAIVRIPSLLRELTGGRAEVEASGRTLREIVRSLDAAFPGIGNRLLDEDSLRPELSFAVDGEIADLGLLQPVSERSEIIILPAISGG